MARQQQHQQNAFPRPSTSLASLSYALDVLQPEHDQQRQQQPNNSDTDTDVIDNRHKSIGGGGNNIDFVDYEELRRRRSLGRIDHVGTAAAYNDRPGIETAPSDEHLGDPQLLSAASRSGRTAWSKDASRNQLPPRYEYASKSSSHHQADNNMRHVQVPPGRSPKGVADAHRQSPQGANTNGNKSAPLDSTDADFDALKSRTLLKAFDRMKRDERLATIGSGGGGAPNASVQHEREHLLHCGRWRPDPEGRSSSQLRRRTGEGSYDNDASSPQQVSGERNHNPGNVGNDVADDNFDCDGHLQSDNTKKTNSNHHYHHHHRNLQADATVQSIERTLAQLRTKRVTRQQYGDGKETFRSEEDGVVTTKTTSIVTGLAATEATSSTRTAANATSPARTLGGNAAVSDNNVAIHNNRPRRREKEPSPSPSGRYGATSPVLPEDGLDLECSDRDLYSGNDITVPSSARGDFNSNRMRGNGQEGGGSRREKPIDRMLAKHALVNSDSSPPFTAKTPARSTSRSVRFDEDRLEHQSLVSTLPSLGTDGYPEDDTTMDDDHYFRQDEALNPPTTPVRAAMKTLSRSERLAFQQTAEEVKMAQRVASSDGDEKQNTRNASGAVRGRGGNECWANTKSDANMLADAWSPSAHPTSSPVSTRREEGIGNADANSSQRTPRSPSPMREFLQVKKQLASMSKAIRTPTPDAPGDNSRSVEQSLYRNRRTETNIGEAFDNNRTMNAKRNSGEDPTPTLNVSEEQAAMDEYVKQLRARLPQVGKTGGIASATLTPKRDMRKKSNRIRDARLPAPAAPIGASITIGGTNAAEDTSLLSEGISTMEKQVAEITSCERIATHLSQSTSSSSSESSSSQIAECVRDISPPPTPIRDVRRRERLERTGGNVSSGAITRNETDQTLQRKNYEDDTIFDSLPSVWNDPRDADKSVATEDDNGLLHFMATSSVPSTSPFASPRDEAQPMKSDLVTPNESRFSSKFIEERPADVSEHYRRRDQSVSSDSSTSQSTKESQSMSNGGLNHNVNNRRGASTSTQPSQSQTDVPHKKLSADDRASRDRWVHKRTKSGHSSFSHGALSTPSDEFREYRRDEIGFSGTVPTNTSHSTDDGCNRTASENTNLDSLNAIAAKYAERGEYTLALQAFNKILASHEARYGEIHPFVASTYHNLGIVHSKNAKSQIDPRNIEKSNSEALLCFQNAARVARDALGSDHPNVAVSLVRLGFILLSMEQFENALVTFEEALRVRIASLGLDHALVSKIQNNIGVTCLQMESYADAGEAFHSALTIQRRVLSRLSRDCSEGHVRKNFLQRAKLELADTLCNIASLNLKWADTERLAKTRQLSLLDESISTFEEALQIRLESLGESHPSTERIRTMLEKARGAHTVAKKRPEPKMEKTPAGLLGSSKDIRSKSLAARDISNNEDENSLAENSVLTSQVLCSPGQLDVCGLGGFYRHAAAGNETALGIPTTKRKGDTNERNCCPTEENQTTVWVAPHCILPPNGRRKMDPLFSDDAQFKSILGWPEERDNTPEDLFKREGIAIPRTESVGSSITMEKINLKDSDENADEESVMITNLALPFDDNDGEGQLPVRNSEAPTESKKKKSRRGLMLIRPSISKRNKSLKQQDNDEHAPRTSKAKVGTSTTSSPMRKSLLRRKSKGNKFSEYTVDIRDIDGGGGGGDNSWKYPSQKEVQKMMKNPERNITALYAIGASHLERKQYAEAESIFKTLLAHHRKNHGEVHPYVGSAMHNLGIVFLRAERHEDALVAFEDAARVRKAISSKNGGVVGPDVATTLVKVGITNLLLKRFERALESFTEALSIRRRALGELDPQVGRVYNNIGCVNCELNQLNEACGAFEASLEVQRHALSLDGDNASLKFGMSTTLCNLGYLYHREGRHLKSVAALKEALELQEALLGKHHPTVLTTLDNLADAHARINGHQEAIRLYSDCLTRHTVSVEEGNGQMNSNKRHTSALILFKISRIHMKQKEFDMSHRKLKEARFYAQGLGDGTEEKIEAEIQKIERSRK